MGLNTSTGYYEVERLAREIRAGPHNDNDIQGAQ
jgi:hypothetical protein